MLAVALLPSLWLSATGETILSGTMPRFAPGVALTRSFGGGVAYAFDGLTSGIQLPDSPSLSGTRSLTVSTWIYIERAPRQPGQLIFRGDDRDGLDAFSLVLWPDGTVHFGIGNAEGRGDHVGASLPPGQWNHVMGTLDDASGRLAITINGRVASEMRTSIRPLQVLDSEYNPGIGIGNVQFVGRHNQPFKGSLADVRVYPFVVSAADAGFELAKQQLLSARE